jgi:hypothetical protein
MWCKNGVWEEDMLSRKNRIFSESQKIMEKEERIRGCIIVYL